VLSVLWEVTVGHIVCGRLHVTENGFPDIVVLAKDFSSIHTATVEELDVLQLFGLMNQVS
jgi:hypothetical protein